MIVQTTAECKWMDPKKGKNIHLLNISKSNFYHICDHQQHGKICQEEETEGY